MSEYGEYAEIKESDSAPTVQTERRESSASVNRFMPVFLASIALVCTAFIPWLQIRLPGLEHRSISLIDLNGGRIFFGLATVLLVIGFILVSRVESVGIILISVGVALLGWLAGLVMLVVSLVRGLIPNIALVGIDLSEGLIGQGTGTIMAVVCTIFLGMQLTVRQSSKNDVTRTVSNPLKLVVIALSLILAFGNHLPWLTAEVGSVSGRLEISGDSLFGNFLVGLITWFVVSLSAVSLISKAPVAEKVAAIGLIILAILKLLQLIFLWAGSGLVQWILPGGVENIASTNLQVPYYVSLVAAVLSIPISILVLISKTNNYERKFEFPDLLISIILLVASVGFAIVLDDESTKAVETTQSSIVQPEQPADVPVSDIQSSAYLSVVYIEMTDGVDVCWSGSGVFVGDGTRVLTNAHVAAAGATDPADCNQLFVGITTSVSQEPDEFFEALPLEIDEANDLAILEVVGVTPGQFPVLKPNFAELAIGSNVEVMGYPGVGGSTLTLTKGTVAGVLTKDSGYFYKVEVTINRGNSGGPMLNEDGELVGIATEVTGNDVECSGNDCQSYGANLGLVRPISFARLLMQK